MGIQRKANFKNTYSCSKMGKQNATVRFNPTSSVRKIQKEFLDKDIPSGFPQPSEI